MRSEDRYANDSLNKKISFIMKFATALHSYGAAAHNLEQAMKNITKVMGLNAQIFATPTVLIVSFETADEQRQCIARVSPGDVHLEKMTLLDQLGDKVIGHEIRLDDASSELQSIISKSNIYPKYIEALAYMLISASAAVLFGGGINDLLISAALGLFIGIYTALAPREQGLIRFFEFITAFLASFIASVVYVCYPKFSVDLVTLSSLIVFIPGLSLTISMMELATENLAAGTARLMGAVIVFLKMIFGVVLGSTLFNVMSGQAVSGTVINPFPKSFIWIALIPASIAFTIIFKARFKDYIWLLAAGLVAVQTTALVGSYLGTNLGAFFGGFVVALLSNIYARFIKKPAAMIFMPGIILLVPGSIGFRGLQFLVDKNTLAGIDTAFQMFFVSTALVAGLLLANILFTPKRSL
jgi:uncharacterized membrane protein YjjP (DUF1212 family)